MRPKNAAPPKVPGPVAKVEFHCPGRPRENHGDNSFPLAANGGDTPTAEGSSEFIAKKVANWRVAGTYGPLRPRAAPRPRPRASRARAISLARRFTKGKTAGGDPAGSVRRRSCRGSGVRPPALARYMVYYRRWSRQSVPFPCPYRARPTPAVGASFPRVRGTRAGPSRQTVDIAKRRFLILVRLLYK